jgi:hypothetical protein
MSLSVSKIWASEILEPTFWIGYNEARDWSRSLKILEQHFGATMVVMHIELVMHNNVNVEKGRSR